jgi:hypothetical protein
LQLEAVPRISESYPRLRASIGQNGYFVAAFQKFHGGMLHRCLVGCLRRIDAGFRKLRALYQPRKEKARRVTQTLRMSFARGFGNRPRRARLLKTA